ncbi:sigma-54-dependent Fis family transcriptional regulator [candidate division KSB1 bacterium]|nr:sigma-54-dependent Fis family transcriptional regulator [candidate division KSB1 bacterium]
MNESIYPKLPVLLVDDEQQFLLSAEMALNANGVTNVLQSYNSLEVMSILSEQEISVILLDITMPHKTGDELLKEIHQEFPNISVIMVTAVNEVETAVECMKNGAIDYLLKPVDETRLVTTLKRAIEFTEVREENLKLKEYLLSDRLDSPDAFSDIITDSENMRSIFQYVEAIGSTSLPVLITGDTGVGKELIARAIHRISGRNGEFVPINVAGVDDNLFSDTLFGHKKGGFTGADRDRKGLIEQASNGTLFLDEIGDLSFESQVKLLRLLQEGKYYPIGSDISKLTNARFVIATNADIDSMQKQGKFRKDLFYRLQAHHINVPILRERKNDIPLLVDHFIAKAAKELGKKQPTPPKELAILLRNYPFPGNIRELEGMIYDAISQHKSGILSMDSFREKIKLSLPDFELVQENEVGFEDDNQIKFSELLPTLKGVEKMLIQEALGRANGNQSIAAEMLGLTRRALNNRLSRSQGA